MHEVKEQDGAGKANSPILNVPLCYILAAVILFHITPVNPRNSEKLVYDSDTDERCGAQVVVMFQRIHLIWRKDVSFHRIGCCVLRLKNDGPASRKCSLKIRLRRCDKPASEYSVFQLFDHPEWFRDFVDLGALVHAVDLTCFFKLFLEDMSLCVVSPPSDLVPWVRLWPLG